MIRIILYLLPLLFLNQVIYANEGSRWIKSNLSELKEFADAGDAYAQGFLALCHLHGDKGLMISHLEARFYAESSASRGHWLGNFVLGYLSRYKPLGPDPAKVKKYLLKSFRDPDGKLIKYAATGDPVAAYVLAEIFISEELQTILQPDMKMAADYYNISALSEYAPACVQSALIKIHGLADSLSANTPNQRKGIELLQKGVEQKLPSAHHYLGGCFLEGIGVDTDKELALVHFQAAADRQYGAALVMVADFYAYGITGEPKENLAFEYIEQAIEIHHEGAEKKLDEYRKHFGQLSDYDPPPKEPVNQNQPAQIEDQTMPQVLPVEHLPKPASMTLRIPSGYSSQESEKTTSSPKDLKKTQTNSRKTEKKLLDNQVSASSINQIRENAKKIYWGRSSNSSMSEAFKSFGKCADLGDAESARYLGIMYLRGKGVAKDAKQALKWLEFAADQGDELAAKNLATLRKIMKL